MINKETYKRLTKKDKYGHWYTDTKINDRFMWSTNGKVWERDLTHCAFDGKAIDRLAELEDKIMDGTLVEQNEWISVKEKLPNYDEKVLVYVPKRDGCRQNGIFTANYEPTKADDGSGNFWGVPTEACEWTIWNWSYFEHPVVTHWIPLPIPPTEAEAKLKESQENRE